jgi:hypothetical protein
MSEQIPQMPIPNQESVQPLTQSPDSAELEEKQAEQRKIVIIVVVTLVLIVLLLAASIYYLMLPTTDTEKIRDVFIIFLAVLSLMISLALVILMVQLAQLIVLIQNDLKPIIESTNETISHVRGTAEFLSDNLAEPVIEASGYAAGAREFLAILGLFRRASRKNSSQGKGE